MYLKCFLALSGNLCTKVVHSPAIQCDVDSGSRTGFHAGWTARVARFNKGLRHSWGALDVGYAFRTLFMRTISKTSDSPQSGNWAALFVVLKRLTETHFMLVHFFTCAVVSFLYTWYIPRGLVPAVLGNALGICDWIRFGSYVCMLAALTMYRRYHTICIHMRKVFLYRSFLLEDFTARNVVGDPVISTGRLAEAILFPLAGVIFGVVPGLVAIFSHLWTDRLPDSVSFGRQEVMEEADFDTLQA